MALNVGIDGAGGRSSAHQWTETDTRGCGRVTSARRRGWRPVRTAAGATRGRRLVLHRGGRHPPPERPRGTFQHVPELLTAQRNAQTSDTDARKRRRSQAGTLPGPAHGAGRVILRRAARSRRPSGRHRALAPECGAAARAGAAPSGSLRPALFRPRLSRPRGKNPTCSGLGSTSDGLGWTEWGSVSVVIQTLTLKTSRLERTDLSPSACIIISWRCRAARCAIASRNN